MINKHESGMSIIHQVLEEYILEFGRKQRDSINETILEKMRDIKAFISIDEDSLSDWKISLSGGSSAPKGNKGEISFTLCIREKETGDTFTLEIPFNKGDEFVWNISCKLDSFNTYRWINLLNKDFNSYTVSASNTLDKKAIIINKVDV